MFFYVILVLLYGLVRVSNVYRDMVMCIQETTSVGRYMRSEGGFYGVTQCALFTPEHIGVIL